MRGLNQRSQVSEYPFLEDPALSEAEFLRIGFKPMPEAEAILLNGEWRMVTPDAFIGIGWVE